MLEPEVLDAMSTLHNTMSRGDFVIFGKKRKKRSRRMKTDPYYKAGIAASRRRRTKVRSERL